MALITKLGTKKVINTDGDRIILGDATGNNGETMYTPSTVVEGEYTSSINTTGYGGGNPSRNTLANFAVGHIKKTEGDVVVLFDSYDPLVASEYVAIAPEDGWYRFHMISVPITIPSGLLEGQCGYDVSTDSIKKMVNGVAVNVTPESLIGTSYMSEYVDNMFIANISFKMSEINEYLISLYKGDIVINRPKISRAQHQYNTLRAIITGSAYEFARNNKSNCQFNIEYLNKYITDINYGV
jgi:hypothetical protein